MGRYNRLNLDKNCPICGAKMECQTKDLTIDGIYPVDNLYDTYELTDRMDAEVGCYCFTCKDSGVDLLIRKGKILEVPEDKNP